MKLHALTAWTLCTVVVGVHASDASCITAGRMNANGHWAPQFQAVRLLDGAGNLLPVKNKSDLTRARFVELTEPALLSVCEGDRQLQPGDPTATAKAPAPAAKPGKFNVMGFGFPKLQTGGELVELKVQVPPEQVVMVTR